MYGKYTTPFNQMMPRWSLRDADSMFNSFLGAPAIFRPKRPWFEDIYHQIEAPFERAFQPFQGPGQILEKKTVRSVTEIKDGQRVTTTETTTLDRDGKQTKETTTEQADMKSIQENPNVEEVKSPRTRKTIKKQ